MKMPSSDIPLRSLTYTGTSMNPTLKAGDRLQVIPYHGREIRRGDVIVFLSPGGDGKITHRVISVDSRGIRTRGDNSQVDAWGLNPEDILGRVVSVQRGNRLRRVVGGPMGHLFAVAVRAMRLIDSGISYLLRPAYHQLTQAGLLRRWLHAWIEIRVVSFNRPRGTELQLFMGPRMIGRRVPGGTRWKIRRPFRLFVDETALPGNPSKLSVDRYCFRALR
jgi:signal peptidase